jgi:Zn-dependent M28 family amino/carboxypeptidase
MHVPTDALGAAWTDDAAWSVLTRLAELDDRMAGHPGEHRAADHVADALADAGARDVTVDVFDVRTWRRGSTDLSVVEPVEREFEAIALPYSPAGDVRAPLVDVGAGTPEEIAAADLDGAVAVASTTTPPDYGRFLHRMEKFGHAVEAGALAFAFRNHKPGQLPPTGSLRFNEEAAVPGVGVSRETGEWLVEYADRGGVVDLRVDASTEPGTSHNVHGVLGPDDGDEIVVVAHHDAHDVAEGALDNGCGVAVLVALARILAASALDTRVRFAGVGSEEIGLLGAGALADSLDLDEVKAVVNLDGVGRYRTLRAFTHASEDALAPLVERVSDDTDRPIAVEEHVHPFSDHWPFLREGVPALQLHSETPERGRGWGHTHADTRDKADSRTLREHAMLAALLVAELADADPGRVERSYLRERLRGDEFEQGMRAAGIWPEEWE